MHSTAVHGGVVVRRCQRLADTLAVEGAVAEAGQRVVRRVVLEPAAARLQLLGHDRESHDDEQEQHDRAAEQRHQLEVDARPRPCAAIVTGAAIVVAASTATRTNVTRGPRGSTRACESSPTRSCTTSAAIAT